MGPRWHLLASGGLSRWPGWLHQRAPLGVGGRDEWGPDTARMEGNTRSSEPAELHTRSSGPAGEVVVLHRRCCPLPARHREGPRASEALLCVPDPTLTICLPFVPPLPLFNCWMSLQSCVPKTINSREQSYTKKGVSPEGDGYPWKPPFHSSLGEARVRGLAWGWGDTLYPEQGPRKCWGH